MPSAPPHGHGILMRASPVRRARLQDLPKLAAIERSAASRFRDEPGLAWIADGGSTESTKLVAALRDARRFVAFPAADSARASGFRRLTLTTYRDVAWNKPFYARLGFAEIDPADAGPQHRRKLQCESEAGHDASRRCIMAKAL